uniref:Uncharacterized protein n=1 Tax=Vitis vinifera TaxID=29760 RepID=F6HG61_VITVI
MEVTVLGHGSSRSAIDPAQVSMHRKVEPGGCHV